MRPPPLTLHPLYSTWKSRACRCRRDGVPWDAAWIDDLHAFARDVGDRPSPVHVLVSVDRARGYVAGNTRWITRQQLTWSDPRTRMVDGVSLSEAANRAGLSREAVVMRVNRGWSVEDALSTPIRAHARTRREVTC